MKMEKCMRRITYAYQCASSVGSPGFSLRNLRISWFDRFVFFHSIFIFIFLKRNTTSLVTALIQSVWVLKNAAQGKMGCTRGVFFAQCKHTNNLIFSFCPTLLSVFSKFHISNRVFAFFFSSTERAHETPAVSRQPLRCGWCQGVCRLQTRTDENGLKRTRKEWMDAVHSFIDRRCVCRWRATFVTRGNSIDRGVSAFEIGRGQGFFLDISPYLLRTGDEQAAIFFRAKEPSSPSSSIASEKNPVILTDGCVGVNFEGSKAIFTGI